MNKPNFDTENFSLPEQLYKDNLPLCTLLEQLSKNKYADLYEREANVTEIEPLFYTILEAIGDPTKDETTHLRYIYIAYTFMLSTHGDTRKFYRNREDNEGSPLLKDKFNTVKSILKDYIEGERPTNIEETTNSLFPYINETGFSMEYDEVSNVLYNSLLTLDPNEATEAVVNILYDSLTGDAISGFGKALRPMFNWFITEVIPSSYYFSLPYILFSHKWPYPSVCRINDEA
jgi:hypothetical protein